MIEQEMLFLGLLMDGPRHGYEIKRKIAEELIPIVGLKIKSVYYPLQRMEELGLVSKDVGREGKFPEKFVYQITPKGRKRFSQLIAESFLAIERPFFTIDLSLYFLPHVDKKIAKRKLQARRMFLRRIYRELEKLTKKSRPSSSQHIHIILEHDLDLVQAEINSLTKLMAVLQ